MNKKIKLFLDGMLEAEVAPSRVCKKKGDIVLSIRTRQVQEYKKINERQIRERKELVFQYQ